MRATEQRKCHLLIGNEDPTPLLHPKQHIVLTVRGSVATHSGASAAPAFHLL